MTRLELAKRIDRATCRRVYGWQDAPNDGNREVIARVLDAFDNTESAILVEPSLSRKTKSPPDVVLIDPEVGVHVFEVKAISLGQILEIQPGGMLVINYRGRPTPRHAINQVRSAMFDIKDATARAYEGELTIPFRYWVVFPSIHRAEWVARFGREGFCPREFLFGDELDRASLLRRTGATDRANDFTTPVRTCRLEELEHVWAAFGDNSVLYLRPEQRPDRKATEGTLGERFDEQAESLKRLSEQQKDLSEMFWENGPRLVRGVAGSGKTIVLANNLARRVRRLRMDTYPGLFGNATQLRVAVVCFNRTLAPFIRSKIEAAYEQRTGAALPEGVVRVQNLNALMYELSRERLWDYQDVGIDDGVERARRYHAQLTEFKARNPEAFNRLAFDAIYVDEGQDFEEAEFLLLRDLCRTAPGAEPNLFIFYDDAQNLYGRGRPNWASLGLNIRGNRSFVMTECFRNPRSIVEPSFNVLYGTAAGSTRSSPNMDFGDIAMLREKGLISSENGIWRIRFAQRAGSPPLLTLAADPAREVQLVIARLVILARDECVRPQDILILTHSNERAILLAEAIIEAGIDGISGVHCTADNKDQPLCQPGQVTVSTIHSAKGYDAFVVLLVSANEFPSDVKGRAMFYVGCTRAVEHLEVFAYAPVGLVRELQSVLNNPSGVPNSSSSPTSSP